MERCKKRCPPPARPIVATKVRWQKLAKLKAQRAYFFSSSVPERLPAEYYGVWFACLSKQNHWRSTHEMYGGEGGSFYLYVCAW